MIIDPVFIIGCPRSGTTLLFNILSESPELHSIGYEGKAIWERHHHPSVKDWQDGVLDANDVTPEAKQHILREFERGAASGREWQQLNTARGIIRQNRLWQRIKGQKGAVNVSTTARTANRFQVFSLNTARFFVRLLNDVTRTSGHMRQIRLLEKTPENCLRLPFLLAIFPDARFIYLTRDGRSNTHSLMEGWKHFRQDVGYRVPQPLHIQDYPGQTWKFTLIPGWQNLTNSPLEVVCARQWVVCNRIVLGQRRILEAQNKMLSVRYEDLIREPLSVLNQIRHFIEIDSEPFQKFVNGLPLVNTISRPALDKWRHENPEAIARIIHLLQPVMHSLGYDDSSD